MARRSPFALALLGGVILTTGVFALGSDHPKGPVTGNERWPGGLEELANRQDRVHGYWVNETDVFFYNGDTVQLNQFLIDCAQLHNTSLHVVLHPGAKKARSPWDQADRDIPVSWVLYASFHPLEGSKPKAGDQYHTRVDVWLGSQVKLEDLDIPAEIEVVSGGEIERFIAERQAAPKP